MRDKGKTISVRRFIRMFGCDTARICEAGGKMFLIIGWRQNTKDDDGQWYRNGEPIDFDYTKEQVIASGRNMKELVASAREYKRLLPRGRREKAGKADDAAGEEYLAPTEVCKTATKILERAETERQEQVEREAREG